ncbi:carbohydrate-binding domain-containing protein [Heterostelium album PN500]|uniref:Carbohydrate-binding domain-containing protein n=1 Tax=Heterostelium pallidum (strain ATCC 26659 / Pp 5 / PN500) TaxID=670386 RepID=D3B952_HETP5|nr:carbohydrate-binding domain-containing protein [Heterostelium album PN500]EFA82091.1 carbohydrate-binding domain-containing protein [Heterostelium album PN500]|eukprot:XP_020434208.1 carbohydrate-binding domain-containing protein [Heterostelium album PN500]
MANTPPYFVTVSATSCNYVYQVMVNSSNWNFNNFIGGFTLGSSYTSFWGDKNTTFVTYSMYASNVFPTINSLNYTATYKAMTSQESIRIPKCELFTNFILTASPVFQQDSRSMRFVQYLNVSNPMNQIRPTLGMQAPGYWIDTKVQLTSPYQTNWVIITYKATNLQNFNGKSGTFYPTSVSQNTSPIPLNNPYDNVRTTVLGYNSKSISKTKLFAQSFVMNIANLNSALGFGNMGYDVIYYPVLGNRANATYHLFVNATGSSGAIPLNLFDQTYTTNPTFFGFATSFTLLNVGSFLSSIVQDNTVNSFILNINFVLDTIGLSPVSTTYSIPITNNMYYPVGIRSVTNNGINGASYKFSFDSLYPNVTYSDNVIVTYYGKLTNIPLSFTWTPTPPAYSCCNSVMIQNLQIFPVSSFTFIVRFDIFNRQFFGVQQINLYNTFMYGYHLVKGNINNGVFELIVDWIGMEFNSFIYPVSYYPTRDGAVTVETQAVNDMFQFLPQIPSQLTQFTVDDITSFKFEPNVVDVSNGTGSTTLIFNFSNSKATDRPSIYFPSYSHLPGIIDTNNVFTGYYNASTNMFNIPITIRQQLFSRSLNYNLTSAPSYISRDFISLKFGSDAFINVVSDFYTSITDADEMGPNVEVLKQYPGNTVTVQATDDVTIGWDFILNDKPSGFSHGVAMISSNIDIIPINITFTSLNNTDGDEFYGNYSIRLPINGNCRSQVYHIDLVLYDYLGNEAASNYGNSITPRLNPFFKLWGDLTKEALTNITVNCAITPDIMAPAVTAFTLLTPTIDVGSNNRIFQATFTVTDDLSGISTNPKDYPVVVLSYLYGENTILTSTLSSTNGLSSIFTVNSQLPYGFAMKGNYLISIYGVVDKHKNLGGITSSEMKTAGMTYFGTTTFGVTTPVLETADRLTNVGGPIYIRGKKMGFDSDTVSCQINYGAGYQSIPINLRYPSIFLINVAAVTGSSIKVQLTVNGIVSNELEIFKFVIPPPGPRPPPRPTLSPISTSTTDSISTMTPITTTSTTDSTTSTTGTSTSTTSTTDSTTSTTGTSTSTTSTTSTTEEHTSTSSTTDPTTSTTVTSTSTTSTTEEPTSTSSTTDSTTSTTGTSTSTTSTTSTTEDSTSTSSTTSTTGASTSTTSTSTSTTTSTTSTPSPSPDPKCPGVTPCSGNGICIAGECFCNNPWYGPDCNSKNHVIPPPPINPDQPTINNTIPSGSDALAYIVSIISVEELHEISANQEVIASFKLANWTMTNLTTETQFLYRYDVSVKESTNITVDVEYFQNETTIVFGNENLTMLPSTIKYSISMTPYQFQDKLTTLQLIMSATIETKADGTCSAKTIGGAPNDLQWVKLNIDKQSLYGRFLRFAVIDNNVQPISNVLLDSEMNPIDTESSVQTFIGINIPQYENGIKLDPDFSVLIDNDSPTDSKCKSKNNKLSAGAIAGITVGAAVFCAAVIGGAILIKSKLRARRFNIKLKKKLNSHK